MHTRSIVIATIAAVLISGSGVAFGDENNQRQRSRQNTGTLEDSPYRVSNLLDKEVKNAKGEDLGEIKDIVVDPYYGEIAYAVLSFGGFLGLGDKYFAIPWRALEPAKEGHFILNVDKERLKNAPGFDKENWPNMGNRQWATSVHEFYGQSPYWSQRAQKSGQGGPSGQSGIAVRGQPVIIRGEVLNIKGEFYVIKDQSGREVRMHVDQDTKMSGNIQPGDRIQADVTQASHAQAIKKLGEQ